MFQDGSEGPPTYSRLRCRPREQTRLLYKPTQVPADRRDRSPGLAAGKGDELHPGPRSAASGSSRKVPEKCSRRRSRRERSVLADRARPRRPRRQPESPRPASRAPPFTTTQFHVLLNSLFKVLFNFPSRYLFAIGLGVIFSLTWSLPRTLSCTPKQLDSRGKASTAQQPSYGPITLYGLWPQSRWTWTGRRAARRLPQTPHSTRPRWPEVRCWALPVSFAITKGITVVFFSSAY